jgi:6-phosphofructo-2-kinase/fructose-2,6-biphosphatase 2
MKNIREVKLSSPDYVGVSEEQAIADFQDRINQYAKQYETLSVDEMDGQIAFVKLQNVGSQVFVNKVSPLVLR